MPQILCHQSYPQLKFLGNQLQTVGSKYICSWPVLFPFSLPHVVMLKSKVKQGLNEALESFATSTEVQETECGQKPEMRH